MNSKSNPVQISILLPVFNEEDNLIPLVEEIVQTISPLGRLYEILMVDDRSTDRSAILIEELSRKYPFVRGVFFRANKGQTAAFDAGFREARGSIIVTMDADRQNDPKDIPKMLTMIDHEGYDFVTGWRRQRQDGFIFRKMPSKIANWIIRRVTGTKLRDMGCSLKVYRKEITHELRLYGEMHRFIALGLLAELVIRTYFESQDRRTYNVRKRVGFGDEQAAS